MAIRNSGVQTEFLEQCVREKTGITIFLVNGFQMHGTVLDHDDFMLKVKVSGRESYIFKHAISTLTPDPKGGPIPNPEN